MAIKSQQILREKVDVDFPKLMISGCHTIVLFTQPMHGMVLVKGSNDSHKVGDYSSGFNMDAFRDYHAAVTLSNE